MQEGYNLPTSANGIRGENSCARSIGNPPFCCPGGGIVVVGTVRNIVERAAAVYRFWGAGCSPQECNDLSTGTGGLGREGLCTRPSGYPLFNGPADSIVIVGAGGYIIETSRH